MTLYPSEHYDDLKKVLDLYWRTDDRPLDCLARILLDVRNWAGNAKLFYNAVRESGELALAQYDQAVKDLTSCGLSSPADYRIGGQDEDVEIDYTATPQPYRDQ